MCRRAIVKGTAKCHLNVTGPYGTAHASQICLWTMSLGGNRFDFMFLCLWCCDFVFVALKFKSDKTVVIYAAAKYVGLGHLNSRDEF